MEKKYILLATAALLSASTFAQSSSDLLKDLEDKVITKTEKTKSKPQKEWKTFDGSILCNYGYGGHSLRNPSFTPTSDSSDEIFITLGEIRYSPVEPIAFSTGIELRWDSFGTSAEGFSVGTDNQVYVIPKDTGVDKNYSRINIGSLVVPFDVRAKIGVISLRAGVDLIYHYRCNVINTSETGRMTTQTKWKKVGANKLGWDVTTAVEVFGLGFYYRFYPDSIFPENGLNVRFHTIGLYCSLF